jgi:signal transduction histidine kinase
LGQATPELTAVDRQTDGLLRLSQRARQLEALVAGETTDTETDLAALARDRVAALRERDHDVSVETTLPSAPVVVDGNELLGAAVDELLDNVAHHAGPAATARVELTREDAMATLTVADDGPGLPETEAAVVDRTTETDLDHASGIGLWFVTWVLVELGGEVTVDGDDGTTVELHVPLATDGREPATDDRDATADDQEPATGSTGSSDDAETDDTAGVESDTVTDGGERDDESRPRR